MEKIIDDLPLFLVSLSMFAVIGWGIAGFIFGDVKVREVLKKFFTKIGLVPRYTELNLFLMNFIFVLALLSFPDLFSRVIRGIIFVPVLFFVYCVCLSTYHVFSHNFKTKFQKDMLLCLAIIYEAFIGIIGFLIMKENTVWYLKLLPTMNLFHGALLFFAHFKLEVFDDISVNDMDVKPKETLVSILIISGIFFLSNFMFNHHIFVTLIICFGYIPLFSGLVSRIFNHQGTNDSRGFGGYPKS